MRHYIKAYATIIALMGAMLLIGGCTSHPTILKSKSGPSAPIVAPICPICGQPELPYPDDCGKPPGHKGPHGNKGHHYGQFKAHNHPAPHSNV